MLSLKSVHLVLVAVSVVLTAGLGMWALLNNYPVVGIVSLGAAVLLVVYGAYFVRKTEEVKLE